MNKIFIEGTLTRDVTVYETGSGTPFCHLNVACERATKTRDGNKITDWFDCTIWGELAYEAAKKGKQGAQVMVWGEAQNRTKTNDDGSTTRVTEIRVFEVGFGIRQTGASLSEYDGDGNPFLTDAEAPQRFPDDRPAKKNNNLLSDDVPF